MSGLALKGCDLAHTLSKPDPTRYTRAMKSASHVFRALPLARIGIAAAIGALMVAALTGWSMHGTAILFTYAQDGLAWCL